MFSRAATSACTAAARRRWASASLRAPTSLRAPAPTRSVSTSARCEVAGRFDCRLVVSMRPVPEASLGPACRLTHPRQDVHGAPVHIGDPGLLGIRDLSAPDFGDSVSSDPGDVPVFWACGVTGVEAVQSAHLSLAFTHAPGCMFVTDVKGQSAGPAPEQREEGEAGAPEVVCVSRDPLLYSLVSAGAASAVHALERHVQLDPGSRGIKHLHVPGELLRAALSLSHSRSVLLITGFPTHVTQQPPEETDGPPGALAMAAALRALGKRVALATDARAAGLMRDIVTDALREGVLDEEVPVVTMEGRGQDAARAFLLEDGPEGPTPRYDHLVAIERAGAAADGCYYNARKINIGHLVDPLDELFWLARDTRGVSTTGEWPRGGAGSRFPDSTGSALTPAWAAVKNAAATNQIRFGGGGSGEPSSSSSSSLPSLIIDELMNKDLAVSLRHASRFHRSISAKVVPSSVFPPLALNCYDSRSRFNAIFTFLNQTKHAVNPSPLPTAHCKNKMLLLRADPFRSSRLSFLSALVIITLSSPTS
ncbi:D-glutamate cyclase, mitochondrial isoform X3 [Lampetra planeri]